MTREMNNPDWCSYKGECNWWQTGIIGICNKCPDCKPKQRKLDDWIKPFLITVAEWRKLKNEIIKSIKSI